MQNLLEGSPDRSPWSFASSERPKSAVIHPSFVVRLWRINSETFVIHFAKGKKRFKGLYQYMYNTFALIMPEKYKYLNFEQDMGNEAIRSSKSSYHPDMMVRKFSVTI